MNSIIVLGRDEELACYYSFLLEGNFDCSVTTIEKIEGVNFDEVSSEKDISMIVISTELKGADDFIKSMINKKLKIPMILTHTAEHRRAAKIKYKYNPLYELHEDGSEAQGFIDISHKALKRKKNIDKSKPKFCRIKTGYFVNSEKTVCDIYLKLSKDKYVKIFNRYHEFTNGDIEKYLSKDTQYFFIKDRDYKVFVGLMSKELESQVLSSGSDDEKVNALTSLNCQEMVQETIDKLGINENAVSIANVAITSTLKLIEKGDVEALFNDIYNNGDYIAEHSLVVTYLASAICRETEWHTRENILRICLAGFFHDITLTNKELAVVSREDSYEFNQLSRRDKSTVINHPKAAVELINKINGVPIGVDTIIDFHHEKYDGSGFPRQVDYKRFSPLAAIFIVAHEIVDFLFESGFVPENIEEVVSDMEELYTRGCFKKIIPVLRNVLNIQNKVDMAG